MTPQAVPVPPGASVSLVAGRFARVPIPGEPARGRALTVEEFPSRKEIFTIRPLQDLTVPTLSPDGQRLAALRDRRTVIVWDVPTRRELLRVDGQNLTGLGFSPDGKQLFVRQAAAWTMWEVASGLRVLRIDRTIGRVPVLSLDGRRLALGSAEGEITLRDAATGDHLRTLKGHTGWVLALAFSPKGDQLASAGHDKVIKIWDAATGQELRALGGHAAQINDLAFSPDGGRLASASFDKSVKIWDPATGREILTLRGHFDGVRDLAFSPDGHRLFSRSGSPNGPSHVRVWDGRPWEPRRGQESNKKD